MPPRKRLKKNTDAKASGHVAPGLEDKPLEFWRDSYYLASSSLKTATKKLQDVREMKDAEIAELREENRILRSKIARTRKHKRTKI